MSKWSKFRVLDGQAIASGKLAWTYFSRDGEPCRGLAPITGAAFSGLSEALGLLEEMKQEALPNGSVYVSGGLHDKVLTFLAKHRVEEKQDISNEPDGIRLLSLEANIGRIWARLSELAASR